MSDLKHLWPGVSLALGSAVLFGASAPVSKLLLGSIDPWLLAGMLYLGAGIGLSGSHFETLPGYGNPKPVAGIGEAIQLNRSGSSGGSSA